MPWHAIAIATAMGGFLRARGHWDQAADQYQTALRAARQAGDRPGQAGTLDELGLLQQLTGDYPAATASWPRRSSCSRTRRPARPGLRAATTWAWCRQTSADYPAAAASHQQALALARDAGDQLAEAVSLTDLGLVQLLTGDYAGRRGQLQQALPLFRRVGSRVRRGRRPL